MVICAYISAVGIVCLLPFVLNFTATALSSNGVCLDGLMELISKLIVGSIYRDKEHTSTISCSKHS